MTASEARPLRHVLYTNARGETGEPQGFRPILDFFGGGEREAKPIIEWLKGFEESAEGVHSWAAQSFLVGEVFHATLGILSPRFGQDDGGRRAMLAHALLVPVHEDRLNGNFYLALHERATSFFRDQTETIHPLKDYRSGCEVNRELKIPELNPIDLDRLDQDFLREFLVTAAHIRPGSQPFDVLLPGAWHEEDLPEMLVKAGCALPPPLRLAFPWATGLKPGSTLFVVHRLPADDPPGIRGNLGEVYFEWLQNNLHEERYDVIRQVAEDFSIISWEKLRERIASTSIPHIEIENHVLRPQEQASAVSDAPPAHVHQEEKAMKPKARPKPTSPPSPDSLDDLKELIHGEFESMWEAVEEHLEDRLNRMGVPPVNPDSSGDQGRSTNWMGVQDRERRPQGRPGRNFGAVRFLLAFRPEIYLALVLLFLGWPYIKKHMQGPRDAVAEAENPPAPVPVGPPAPAPKVVDFVAQWRDYLRNNKDSVAGSLRAVASQKEIYVTEDIQKKLNGWADKLDKMKEALNSDEAEECAKALLQYAHAEWAKGAKDAKGEVIFDYEDMWVSDNASEVNNNLVPLVKYYGLSSDLPNPPSLTDKAQAAIALKWLLASR